MANPTAQQCHAMTTYFINGYKDLTASAPVVNRNKAKAGWSGMLMDFTPTQARELVDHYLAYYEKPRIDWFLYNYEKVAEDMKERNEAKEVRRLRRAETERRAKEWEERWKK